MLLHDTLLYIRYFNVSEGWQQENFLLWTCLINVTLVMLVIQYYFLVVHLAKLLYTATIVNHTVNEKYYSCCNMTRRVIYMVVLNLQALLYLHGSFEFAPAAFEHRHAL